MFVASLVARLRGQAAPAPDEPAVVYLLEGENLIDSSPLAESLMPTQTNGGASDLERVTAMFVSRFPGLSTEIEALGPGEGRQLQAESGGGHLALSRWGDRLRLALHENHRDPGALPGAGSSSLAVATAELAVLRGIGEGAPLPIWRQTHDGHITWANRSYLALATLALPEAAQNWPPPTLFELPPAPPDGDSPAIAERQLALPETAAPQWFEVTALARGGETLCFAVEISRMILAEEARRNFMQVLVKTFAQLSTGLAIFDRHRQMIIFNPAFLDLTGLQATFASAQPTLAAVLDRLRDRRLLPEPKNYRSWREQVMALEAEAREGSYCETWVLPGGQTYRVSGRPQPEGAIAFFFEDITGEVALTRHFREELSLAQAVFDQVDEAIAVFSAGGRLAMANEAYERYWGNSEERLREISLAGEIDGWRRKAAPSPIWERLRNTADRRDSEAGWVGLIKRIDGRAVHLRVAHLPGGALLVGFRSAVTGVEHEYSSERTLPHRNLVRSGS